MKANKLLFIASSVLVIVLFALIGCDDRDYVAGKYHIANISANPDTIYADNNVTFSEIEVLVRDEDNFSVPSEKVTFRSNLGNLLQSAYTDSAGVAHTTFWDQGDLGTALIEAFVGDQSASVAVEIVDAPIVEDIAISAASPLSIDETGTVKATVLTTEGFVSDGTTVVFTTDLGNFESSAGVNLGTSTQATTLNGEAIVYFNAGAFSGTATVTAAIANISANQQITIKPGVGRYIYLEHDENSIAANNNETLSIMAKVTDRHQNPVVRNTAVAFTSTLGDITATALTDSMGWAEAIFSPGINAGNAEITAVADSATATTTVQVTSDEIASIQFAFSGKVDIQIQGTGGQESYELKVNLYDMNGNLIDETKTVYFQLINAPAGTNINNVGLIDSTQSSNGQAVVSINSGTTAGPASVKAYVVREDSTTISAVKSNIVVHAGPPNSVSISVGDTSTGVSMGGGFWRVECAALLNDVWGNPVDHGTSVFFSLPDDPDWATISASAYVGNENAAGDTLAGVAYTTLIYDGSHTNEELLIRVETAGSEPGQVFVDEDTIILPIQFPIIDLAAVPQHLDWVGEVPNPQPLDSTIRVKVLDGQNNPVDGVDLVFSTTLGQPQGIGDPYVGTTGIISGEHGRLDKAIRFQRYECPPPDPTGAPGSINATVTVQILGSQVSNSVDVILYRYLTTD